jgi:heat shock protein HslJ
VRVGQIAATQMMCPEALMTQEQAFFAALASIGRFDIDATGALRLFDPAAAEPVLTARR